MSLKNLKITGVFTLLVMLALPTKEAKGGILVGLQGGYTLNHLYGADAEVKVGSAAPVKTSFKRSEEKDLKDSDMQGGFIELNFDYTVDMGMLYIGGGLYAQWAGTKYIEWEIPAKQKLTNSILIGPEFIVGFNVMPVLDISIRLGVGFNGTFPPKYVSSEEQRKQLGVNWRVLPAFTYKIGTIGIFLEAGYQGNWIQQTDEETVAGITTKVKQALTQHGAQVGMGVKFYL